jgi:hypothetical protein
MIRTTFAGFMGLLDQRARCHDHKFDPITRMDYYRTVGMFFGFVNYDHLLVPKNEDDEWYQTRREILRQIAPLKKAVAHIEAPLGPQAHIYVERNLRVAFRPRETLSHQWSGEVVPCWLSTQRLLDLGKLIACGNCCSSTSLNAPGDNNRPNVNGPKILGHTGPGEYWFNVKAFSLAPSMNGVPTIGHVGRNVLHGHICSTSMHQSSGDSTSVNG